MGVTPSNAANCRWLRPCNLRQALSSSLFMPSIFQAKRKFICRDPMRLKLRKDRIEGGDALALQ